MISVLQVLGTHQIQNFLLRRLLHHMHRLDYVKNNLPVNLFTIKPSLNFIVQLDNYYRLVILSKSFPSILRTSIHVILGPFPPLFESLQACPSILHCESFFNSLFCMPKCLNISPLFEFCRYSSFSFSSILIPHFIFLVLPCIHAFSSMLVQQPHPHMRRCIDKMMAIKPLCQAFGIGFMNLHSPRSRIQCYFDVILSFFISILRISVHVSLWLPSFISSFRKDINILYY